MARSRFHRLAPAQQRAILGAALSEFSAHGYADASLNRIIEAAGTSKGSMYYYFESKEDLYASVIREQVESLLADAGPFPDPAARDPDAYWAVLAEYYLRLMTALLASPDTAGLIRDWIGGASARTLSAAERDAEQAVLPWLLRALAAGQEVGAVRTDLPNELLLAVAMAMGQAIDLWLIAQGSGADDLDQTVTTLIDLIRRTMEPT